MRYESTVALFASQAMKGRPLLTGPVRLSIKSVFAWPASWSAKKRDANQYKVSKPDGDNIQKAVSDALNGVVYADDSQVVVWMGLKRYGDMPYLWVAVRPCA